MSKKKKAGGLNKVTLTNSILGIFSKDPNKTYNYKQIARQLLISGSSEKKMVIQVLNELTETGTLEEIYIGKFKLKSGGAHAFGKLEMTNNGYAFVINESTSEEIFVAHNNLHHALNGDAVKVHLFAGRKGRRPEGEVIEIMERAKETFVGIIELSDRYAFFTTENRQMPYDLFIPLEKINNAKNGQKVLAKITDWPKRAKNPFGEVIEVLGFPGDNETEMHAILAEFDLPYKFPPEVEEEAEKIPDTIANEEIKSRRDFRKVTTFTIDPADAKDFDDALSIRKLPGGNWEVGIHIADVTYYVHTKSLINDEAYNRGTSVYLVDRVVPMLPERLSNNICSLRPSEEKLCFSAVFELTDAAELKNEWFGRTVIFSDRRFTYQEAQQIIDTGKGDLHEEMLKLNELAKKLRAQRFKGGAIAFDHDEVKFDIDEKGKPLRVYFTEHGESNDLIEEFMLLANKQVASLIGNVKNKKERKTFVYRVHDRPNPDKLETFSNFIRRFGHKLQLNNVQNISKSLNQVLENVKGKKEQHLVETLAVRSMAKAEYSTDNIGHYGLAFPYYTHFTSPIRRYPDMMVHRMLAHYLAGGESKSRKKYEMRCRHSSDMEQKAVDAERASIKYKQVEFMQDKIGQVFDGIISGVTEFGVFVEIIENKCEGLVPIRELQDDYYEYDEDNYCLTGRRTSKKYQLGDPVKVEILRTNLAKKQLDFVLVEE